MPYKRDALQRSGPTLESITRPADDTLSEYSPEQDAADALTTLAHYKTNAVCDSAPEQDSNSDKHPTLSKERSSTPLEHPVVEPRNPTPPPTLEQSRHNTKSPHEHIEPPPTLEQSRDKSKSPHEQIQPPPAPKHSSSPDPIDSHPQMFSPQLISPTPTQQHEPDYERDDPPSVHVREPSPIVETSADIKLEPSATPGYNTPSTTMQIGESATADIDTIKTLAELQNEHGLRGSGGPRDTSAPPTSDVKQAPAPSKKRAAPKSASNKKGASKKPGPKRQKLEVDSVSNNGTNLSRSVTPSRGSKTPAVKGSKKSQSGTPITGASPASYSNLPSSEVEGTDSEEDDALYCICRGKDDHTWMIGCEACDDWFHGRCVELDKKDHEALLAKFICPTCEQEGKGHTTWRSMCRREGCRQASVSYTRTEVVDGHKQENLVRSKYCSEKCGVDFFSNIIGTVSRLNAPKSAAQKKRPAKRKSSTMEGPEHEFEYSDDDYEPPPRGGVLRARDLKAIVSAAPEIAEFHKLGSGVLSPPASPIKPESNAPNGDGVAQSPIEFPYPLTSSESKRLAETSTKKAKLRAHRALLKDRETFVSLIRDRAVQHAENEGLKKTQVCGWDFRLQWNDAEFDTWRTHQYGRACIAVGTFEPSAEQLAKAKPGTDADGDSPMDGGDDAPEADSELDKQYTSQLDDTSWCHKKSCGQHRNWQKLHGQEIRFEDVEAMQAIENLESEEKEIKERAMVRWRREQVGEGLDKESAPAEKGSREGWVEVLG